MKSVLIAIIFGLSFSSCEYDYVANFGEFTPQVVVNSFINPDSTIKVNLFWTKEHTDTSAYKRVDRFSAKIYENENIIFEGADLNDSILTTHYPKEGFKYRLEVNIPDYGEVVATTYIPLSPSINVKHLDSLNSYGRYRHFEINNIELKDKSRSVIVRSMGIYEKHPTKFNNWYYATNPFCDQFNTYIDNDQTAQTNSSIYHDYFIRIPYLNIAKAMPLKFAISNFKTIMGGDGYIGEDDWGYPIYDYVYYNPTHIITEVIAPSNEYDKYLKSAYQQIELGSSEPPIFSQTIPISSNVKNGLGVFAGYSSAIYKIKLEYEK